MKPLILHATTVAFEGRAAVFIGPTGVGKSSLALQLMSLGASLVSDDRTIFTPSEGDVLATAPVELKGMIEARGVGILAAQTTTAARVALVVDLAQIETDRLPPERTYNLLGDLIPMLHKVESGHFPAAILQYLRCGRIS